MKTLKFLTAAAAVVVLAASCTYQKAEKGVEAPLPTNAETDSVSYLIGVNFGYFLKMNNFAKKLSEINMGLVKQGMKDYLKAEGSQSDPDFNKQFKISPDGMNEAFNGFIGKKTAYKAELNQKKEIKFLDANKMKDGVVVTESGLQYVIFDEGNDVKPGPKDTVWVQYTGTLIDGTEFDASDREKDPVKMYMQRVVKGWTEGLQLIGEGGHIQLFVPSTLGYGERGNRAIEPNSTLIFDVELTKVGKVPEKEDEKK